MKKTWLFLLFAVPALAQSPVIGNGVQYVSVAPSGSCVGVPPIQVLSSTGAVYTCNNGTWGSISGGSGSGTVSGQAANVIGLATGATTTGAQSHINEATSGQTSFTQTVNAPTIGPASTATTTVTTPNNANVSLTQLNSNFLRQTRNQWAIAAYQKLGIPSGSVSQYSIGTSYSITAWSSSASTQLLTLTVSTAANAPGPGVPMLVSGLTSGTLFNGQIGTVVSNPLPTTTSITLKFPFTITTSSATETGTAVIQAAQLHTATLEDSTAVFHSGELLCVMAQSFPSAVTPQGGFTGAFVPFGTGSNGNGPWGCSGWTTGSFNAATPTLVNACPTDNATACASNGGTPLPQDFTHFPNGLGYKLYSSGVVTLSQGTENQFIVLLETDPSSGTYLIETNNNNAGWVTSGTGGTTAPSGSATGAVGTGIAYSYAYSTPAPYQIRITCASGCYLYGIAVNNTSLNGVFGASESVGGATIANYGTFPSAILQTWHTAMMPNLITYEAKDNGANNPSGDCSKSSALAPSTYVPFTTLLQNTFNSYPTNDPTMQWPDIIYVGSYDIGDKCVAFQNDVARGLLSSAVPQEVYWDGYFQANQAQMQGTTLNQATISNVHYGLNQQVGTGDALVNYVGVPSWPTSTIANPITTTTVDISKRLGFQDLTSATTGKLWGVTMQPSGNSLVEQIQGDHIFENQDSTGVACFGSNFTSCPAGAMQVSKGNFLLQGVATDPANVSFAGSTWTMAAQTSSSFVGILNVINLKANNQIGVNRFQLNGTNYWDVGMDGNCGQGGNVNYTVCDKQNSKAVVYIPSNTMPALSYGGNSAGPVLGSLVTFGTVYSAAGTALPTCDATHSVNAIALVSDATTPTYLGAYTSGGAVKAPVLCNGTGWVTY